MTHVLNPVLRIPVFIFVFISVLSGCTVKKKNPSPRTEEIRLVSLSPAATAALSSLSLNDHIVGVDRWSASAKDLPDGIPAFALINPDAERIIALEPDIVFVSSMTRDATGTDPFAPFTSSGVTIIYIPVSTTIEDIMNDVRMIARVCGRETEGEAVVSEMKSEIERITIKTQALSEEERKTVYMEIGSAPRLYSFGSGVYLDELITAAGGRNIFSDMNGWLAVNAEQVLERNPQVILTNVPEKEAAGDILSRTGWNAVSAVKQGRVYSIEHESSSQPAPQVTRTLDEIAKIIHPALFPGETE